MREREALDRDFLDAPASKRLIDPRAMDHPTRACVHAVVHVTPTRGREVHADRWFVLHGVFRVFSVASEKSISPHGSRVISRQGSQRFSCYRGD